MCTEAIKVSVVGSEALQFFILKTIKDEFIVIIQLAGESEHMVYPSSAELSITFLQLLVVTKTLRGHSSFAP